MTTSMLTSLSQEKGGGMATFILLILLEDGEMATPLPSLRTKKPER